MIQFNIFPGGLTRIVTFSYDDGPANDVRLVALFNKYGVKGTFHLNSMKYLDKTEDVVDAVYELVHEFAVDMELLDDGELPDFDPKFD